MQAPLTDLKHCSLWAPRPALPACQSRTGLGRVPGRWGRPVCRGTRLWHRRGGQQHPAAAAGSALGSADLPPEQPDAFIDGVDVFPRLKERDVYKCAPCILSTLSLSQGAFTTGPESCVWLALIDAVVSRRRLGVNREASFEEVQDARNFLYEVRSGDVCAAHLLPPCQCCGSVLADGRSPEACAGAARRTGRTRRAGSP